MDSMKSEIVLQFFASVLISRIFVEIFVMDSEESCGDYCCW